MKPAQEGKWKCDNNGAAGTTEVLNLLCLSELSATCSPFILVQTLLALHHVRKLLFFTFQWLRLFYGFLKQQVKFLVHFLLNVNRTKLGMFILIMFLAITEK